MAERDDLEELAKRFFSMSYEDISPEVIEHLGLNLSQTPQEKERYLEAYQELSKTITGQEPSDTPPPESVFLVQVISFISVNRLTPDIKKQICEDFEYCKKRKALSNDALASALLEAGLAGLDILFPGSGTIIWIISTGILDKLCNCPKPKKA